MEAVPPLDVLIPIILLGAALGVEAYRSGSRRPVISGAVALALAILMLAYFLVSRPVYHFILISSLILLIVHILRSRGWL